MALIHHDSGRGPDPRARGSRPARQRTFPIRGRESAPMTILRAVFSRKEHARFSPPGVMYSDAPPRARRTARNLSQEPFCAHFRQSTPAGAPRRPAQPPPLTHRPVDFGRFWTIFGRSPVDFGRLSDDCRTISDQRGATCCHSSAVQDQGRSGREASGLGRYGTGGLAQRSRPAPCGARDARRRASRYLPSAALRPARRPNDMAIEWLAPATVTG